MILKAKPFITGLIVIIVGIFSTYYFTIWIEQHTTSDEWQKIDSSPQGFAMYGYLFTFGLSGYVSARVAKEKEYHYGFCWSILIFLCISITSLFLSSSSMWDILRFPPLNIGWLGVLLIFFYVIAPLVACSAAESVNKKKKPDTAEIIAETTHEGIDFIHDLFKLFKNH